MSAVLASKHQGKDVKMPTIKDIARIAGVSHGTVSNVLNGRGNVSVGKIEAVQRAAREVGYQLNAQAQSLRASKSQGVALILPDINAERYYQLYRGLHQAWQPSLSEPVDLYLTNDLPNLELDILQTLAAKSYQAVVTVSCLDNSQPYYDMLRLSPENVLFAYRQPAGAVCYISLDYVTAGEETARRALARHRTLTVAMVAAQMLLRLMQRVVVIATWAFGYPAAVVAQQRRRKTPTIKKEDNLIVGL
mgnify:CR=1 FL=1